MASLPDLNLDRTRLSIDQPRPSSMSTKIPIRRKEPGIKCRNCDTRHFPKECWMQVCTQCYLKDRKLIPLDCQLDD